MKTTALANRQTGGRRSMLHVVGIASVALVVLCAAPSASYAVWSWDDTCSESSSETLDTIPPQAYLMLDESGSMDNDCCDDSTRWRTATEAIDTAVDDFVDDDGNSPIEFGIGMFADNSENFVTPGGTSTPYEDISDAISDDSADGGGTQMHHGIDRSDNVLSGTSSEGQKVSIFITDGEPNSWTDDDAIEAACNHSVGRMYSVGFGSGADQPFNNALAAAGGTGVCCEPGTTDCTSSHPNYVDICALSDDDLQDYDYGRDLECSGAYQVNTGTGLQDAINDISADLNCTVDASDIWNSEWSESWFGCAPDYDCVSMTIPGGLPSEASDGSGSADRLYHRDSSNSASGWWWEWVDPSQQERIRLSDKTCNHIEGLTDKTVETTRACMCESRPVDNNRSSKAGEEVRLCDVSDPGVCRCAKGRATCDDGFNQCDQFDAINVNDWDSSDDNWDKCRAPEELAGEGETCSACGPDGPVECTKQSVEECQAALEDPPDTTDPCDTGLDGRCSVGVRTCTADGWSECQQVYEPVPEVCNGLDDDCDGDVDDIQDSWENGPPQDDETSWGFTLEDLDQSDRERACGGVHACRCPDGGADDSHRGGSSDSMSVQEEFESVVEETDTACYCME